MEPGTAYRQHIRPARLGVMLTFFAFDFGVFGAVVNFMGGPWQLVGVLAVFMLFMAWLSSAFWELHFEVGPDGVHAGWSEPFARRIALPEIKSAGVQPYPARKFLGWGFRRSGVDRALSDLSCPQALAIELIAGGTVFITLKDPASALAALQAARQAAPSLS